MLSRAHDVLTQESWQAAALGEIVERAAEPYCGSGAEDKIDITGPDVRLEPQSALAFAMALQELATNAAKYGALSAADGHVDIAWSLEPHRRDHGFLSDGTRVADPSDSPPSRRWIGSHPDRAHSSSCHR